MGFRLDGGDEMPMPNRSSSYAPIALFAFRRPNHLRLTLQALRANDYAGQTPLFIFCDGPRDQKDVANVAEVRRISKEVTGFKSVQVIESENNKGLANSVIGGVSSILDQFDRVIVIEDDLVTAPYFLKFINKGLDLYNDEPRVASIHGFMYPSDEALPETFFIRGADCWGWGTWRRAWKTFNSDAASLLSDLDARNLGHAFDFDGLFPYRKMLQDSLERKVDSWAIRWLASAYLADMLTLYPRITLVGNIGFDGTGTHCSNDGTSTTDLSLIPIEVNRIEIRESDKGREAFKAYFRSIAQQSNVMPVLGSAQDDINPNRPGEPKHSLVRGWIRHSIERIKRSQSYIQSASRWLSSHRSKD